MISSVASTRAEALRTTHAWFEVNSGWAPPDPDILAEWCAEGVCRCPDGCLVTPEGICEHGLASWWVIVSELEIEDRAIAERRAGAMPRGQR